MANNCQFCGNYCGKYILCRSCNELKNNGEISKCEDCGEWYVTRDKCKCKKSSGIFSFLKDAIFNRSNEYYGENDYYDEEDADDDMEESICIVCDKPSNGYLFCRNCYHKYKKKTILLSVTNCKKIKIMKETYIEQYTYTCKDGHIVKSKSERDIDNYLFDHRIPHVYEKEIITDEDIKIHPDFYLPDQDAYLEHWGFGKENKAYTAQKQLKMDYYRRSGLTLICTYEKPDAHNIESALERKLSRFQKGKINFEE